MYGERPSKKQFERAANRHLTRAALSGLRDDVRDIRQSEVGAAFMMGYVPSVALSALSHIVRTRMLLSTRQHDEGILREEQQAEGLRGDQESLDEFARRRLREAWLQKTWDHHIR